MPFPRHRGSTPPTEATNRDHRFGRRPHDRGGDPRCTRQPHRRLGRGRPSGYRPRPSTPTPLISSTCRPCRPPSVRGSIDRAGLGRRPLRGRTAASRRAVRGATDAHSASNNTRSPAATRADAAARVPARARAGTTKPAPRCELLSTASRWPGCWPELHRTRRADRDPISGPTTPCSRFAQVGRATTAVKSAGKIITGRAQDRLHCRFCR